MRYFCWIGFWLHCAVALGQNSLSEKQLTGYLFPQGNRTAFYLQTALYQDGAGQLLP